MDLPAAPPPPPAGHEEIRRWLPHARRVRWLFAGLAGLLAVVLLAAAISSYLRASELADHLARGRGMMFMHQLKRSFAPGEQPTPADLQTLVDDSALVGLSYVAIAKQDDGVLAIEGGHTAGFVSPINSDSNAIEFERRDGVTRMSSGTRITPTGFELPPPVPRDGTALVTPWRLVVEFTPEEALEIERWAGRDLAIAVGGTLMLVVVATLFWTTSRRAETIEQQAVAQRHLASLGEMSAVLAHELRNPLSALKGHAQLLEEQLEGKPRDKAGRVIESALRLERLIDGLLAFIRLGRLVLSEVEPDRLARAAAAEFEGERLVLELDAAPAHWRLDPERTTQVLVNLLDNALQAPGEGAVHLRVSLDREALQFDVRDHGPGVPESLRKEIFAPFRTTRVRGAGLGLAVCKRIVEAHGGGIEVKDAPGGGALFRVRIPAAST